MRKTQKKKTIDWQRLASDLAEDMHENNFSSHYGWGRFPKGFYYYNNHPTQSREETLLPSIRAWLKERPELAEVAFASYDLESYPGGYTVAMIITGPASAEQTFEAAMDRLTRRWRLAEAEPQPLAEVIDINRARSRVEA